MTFYGKFRFVLWLGPTQFPRSVPRRSKLKFNRLQNLGGLDAA